MRSVVFCLLLSLAASADEAYRKVRFLSQPSGALVKLGDSVVGRSGELIPLSRESFDGENPRTFWLELAGHRSVEIKLRWGQLKEGADIANLAGQPWTLEPDNAFYWLLDHSVSVALTLTVGAGLAAFLLLRSRNQLQQAQSKLEQASVLQEEAQTSLQQVQAALATDRWLGQEIKGYRTERLVGKGAFGRVYRAVRVVGDGPDVVAVKICALPPGETVDSYRGRLSREFSCGSKLRAPELIFYYDWGPLDGEHHFFHMEFVEGAQELSAWMKDNPNDPDRFFEILRSVATGLCKAHQAQVFHRDLKPENILLTADLQPKIGDFGLALDALRSRITQADRSLGTLAYMAPEVISPQMVVGEEKSDSHGALDQYSLGVIIYEYLDRIPHIVKGSQFGTEDGFDYLGRLTRMPDELSDVGDDFNRCLLKMLATSPKDRYADIKQGYEALYSAYLQARATGAGRFAR